MGDHDHGRLDSLTVSPLPEAAQAQGPIFFFFLVLDAFELVREPGSHSDSGCQASPVTSGAMGPVVRTRSFKFTMIIFIRVIWPQPGLQGFDSENGPGGPGPGSRAARRWTWLRVRRDSDELAASESPQPVTQILKPAAGAL